MSNYLPQSYWPIEKSHQQELVNMSTPTVQAQLWFIHSDVRAKVNVLVLSGEPHSSVRIKWKLSSEKEEEKQ